MSIKDLCAQVMSRAQAREKLGLTYVSDDLEDQMDAMQAYKDACDETDKYDYLKGLIDGFEHFARFVHNPESFEDEAEAKKAYKEACYEFDAIPADIDFREYTQFAFPSPGSVVKNVVA